MAEEPAVTLGHVALHYRNAAEGPLAARLLEALGFRKTQELSLPNGSNFYRFVVADHFHARGDGIVFLSVAPEAEYAVIREARRLLRVGEHDENPAVTQLRAAMAHDPEYAFHVGFLAASLDGLEHTFANLEELNRSDPDMKGRLTLLYNRPPRGDAEIDTRLDRSPLFGPTKRETYGKAGVQAFLRTDILFSGPLGDGLSIEFDYVFPGRTHHILSVADI